MRTPRTYELDSIVDGYGVAADTLQTGARVCRSFIRVQARADNLHSH